MHGLDILHRDLKPENMVMHKDPRTGERAGKLIDFGMSAFTSADVRSLPVRIAGKPVGTKGYMAPELLQKASAHNICSNAVHGHCFHFQSRHFHNFQPIACHHMQEKNASSARYSSATDMYSMGVSAISILSGIAPEQVSKEANKYFAEAMNGTGAAQKSALSIMVAGVVNEEEWGLQWADTAKDRLRDAFKVLLRCLDPNASCRPGAAQFTEALKLLRDSI